MLLIPVTKWQIRVLHPTKPTRPFSPAGKILRCIANTSQIHCTANFDQCPFRSTVPAARAPRKCKDSHRRIQGQDIRERTKREGNEIDVVASRSFVRTVARRSSLAGNTPLFPCLHDVPTVFSIAVVAANGGRPGNTELPFNLVKSSKSFPQASGRKVLALSDFMES